MQEGHNANEVTWRGWGGSKQTWGGDASEGMMQMRCLQ
jgi:hypothetical protein